MVQEYDAISTPGLVYYSLRPTTMSKNANQIEKAVKENITVNEEVINTSTYAYISANQDIELETEGGFFNTSNSNIKIKQRTSSKIIFSIPFGIEEVTIQTKKKGDIVEKTYRVV